jgi:ubiquinone/menaquinone biosynthesis C-methylase UbiE
VAHKFHPGNMARLESEERRRRQPPERLLAAIGVSAGMRVADVGCGPGFYTLPLSHAVGPSGTVHALDLEEAMLARVRERAAAEGLANVVAARSEESRLPLGDGSVDLVLLANVLHEAADRVAFLREARRVLAPGGRLAVVEWRRADTGMGPPLEERLAEEDVRAALRAAGFEEASPLEPGAVGPTHYGMVADRGPG